jgi:alpha-D-ribose 1-methylphosphonate 5-triphosphate diphosphatase
MNDLIINNACIVTPAEVIKNGSVVVVNGKIVEVSDSTKTNDSPNFQRIDAGGKYLLPGIIDLHTDAIDLEICPRPGADFPIEVAFRELEKRMCGVGITTVFHSMHLGSREYEKELRSKYSRMDVFEQVFAACNKHSLINNKIHLRYESTGVDEYDQCIELVKRGYISFFSFMDHTPTEELLTGEKLKAFAARYRLSEDQAIAEIKARMARPGISKQKKSELIRFLKEKNIPIASHDDRTTDAVEENHQTGISISEFPITMEVAKKATELNMDSIGGAANVLRGGSNIGNLKVQDAVGQRIINILCSDYYPPAILHSIFILHKNNILSLPESVNIATLNPAKAAKIDRLKGSIEKGKEADLLLVDTSNSVPMLYTTIVGGNISGEYSLKQTSVYECYN